MSGSRPHRSHSDGSNQSCTAEQLPSARRKREHSLLAITIFQTKLPCLRLGYSLAEPRKRLFDFQNLCIHAVAGTGSFSHGVTFRMKNGWRRLSRACFGTAALPANSLCRFVVARKDTISDRIPFPPVAPPGLKRAAIMFNPHTVTAPLYVPFI